MSVNKIGVKDIQNIFANHYQNGGFSKKEYEASEIDKIILDFYGINCFEFEDATENSGEFENIVDVYELIDCLMENYGYESSDMTLYKKKESFKTPLKELECENQISIEETNNNETTKSD